MQYHFFRHTEQYTKRRQIHIAEQFRPAVIANNIETIIAFMGKIADTAFRFVAQHRYIFRFYFTQLT